MLASAGIVLALGSTHLAYTFLGRRLWPRDDALQRAMAADTLRLTRQTTVWKAWIGFNASHSLGAMLFGLVYGHLAWAHPDLLFRSPFLLVVGGTMLGSLLVLAKRCWFSVPMGGLALALGLFLAAVVARQG